ncbi:MAG TPA: hypothetical protein VEF89_17840 [Solirubrobacteraceae bacterium]|nr:hypothetical protein [Solirubrobacteraceae bacterium]
MSRELQGTDGELLAAVVAGDGQAFSVFYRGQRLGGSQRQLHRPVR